jgi:hypothetical protein
MSMNMQSTPLPETMGIARQQRQAGSKAGEDKAPVEILLTMKLLQRLHNASA